MQTTCTSIIAILIIISLPLTIIIAIAAVIALLKYITDNWADEKEPQKKLEQARHIEDILKLSPRQFEIFCKVLFQEMGYKVTLTRYTNDRGVDLELRQDDWTGIVQCKRWTNWTVGRPKVQQLYGEMVNRGADHAWVVTTSYFSHPARQFAKGKPITLIDKRELLRNVTTIQKAKAAATTRPQVQAPATQQQRTAAATKPQAPAPVTQQPQTLNPTPQETTAAIQTKPHSKSILRYFYDETGEQRCSTK